MIQFQREISNATLKIPETKDTLIRTLIRNVQVQFIIKPINCSRLFITNHSEVHIGSMKKWFNQPEKVFVPETTILKSIQ